MSASPLTNSCIRPCNANDDDCAGGTGDDDNYVYAIIIL